MLGLQLSNIWEEIIRWNRLFNPSLSIETAFVVTVMKPLIHTTYLLVVLHTHKEPSKKPVGMFDGIRRIQEN
jgi:hypothetical protein